ncbi:MAG: M67 family metallopeptidase [Thermoleophilaceae bacterium]|nr:M67 family metallopeptidase [Thermoleophilaceae bacterium]
MRLTAAQREELLAHARETAPEECCGVMRLSETAVQEILRAKNHYRSPRYGYELGIDALMPATEWEDEGFGVVVYHSHPRSPAEPSETDRNLAGDLDWIHLIVSPLEDSVRAWWLKGGKVEEEPVEVG